MAPELYQKVIEFPLDKSDVFALGVILINFITGDYTFDSVFDAEEVKSEAYERFMNRPGEYLKSSDENLINLISGMLSFRMEDRFSI